MNEVKILNIGGSNQNIKDQYARNIIAPSENNLTAQDQPYASRDYDEGDYLIGQDRNLYKALTDIHTGDILAVNVNIKATTISDELVALEDSSVEEALEVIAYTENSSLSTRAYAVGDNLYWNYGATQGLYKVTTAIAIGDAFAVGSNIEAAEPIAKQLEVVDDEVDTIVNDLGAKNLINIYATSQVISGVTFTVNPNKTITAVGTATEQITFAVWDGKLPSGRYIKSGCPSGGSNSTYFIGGTAGTSTGDVNDYGEGFEFETTDSSAVSMVIVIRQDVTVNLTFKPMIRPAGVQDRTYVPYAMTNRELTDGRLKYVDYTIPSETYASHTYYTKEGSKSTVFGIPATAKIVSVTGMGSNYNVIVAGWNDYAEAQYLRVFLYNKSGGAITAAISIRIFYIL